MQKETPIRQDIQVALSAKGTRLFRNNVGLFKTADGRKVKTGLCVGSSDLIGLTPITITPQMVGRQVAVFTAVEVKTKTGKKRKEQELFIAMVQGLGGIGFFAKSVGEALSLLEEEKASL